MQENLTKRNSGLGLFCSYEISTGVIVILHCDKLIPERGGGDYSLSVIHFRSSAQIVC